MDVDSPTEIPENLSEGNISQTNEIMLVDEEIGYDEEDKKVIQEKGMDVATFGKLVDEGKITSEERIKEFYKMERGDLLACGALIGVANAIAFGLTSPVIGLRWVMLKVCERRDLKKVR